MSIVKKIVEKLPAIPSTQGVTDPVVVKLLDPIKHIIEQKLNGPLAWLTKNSLQGVNGVLADILTNGGTSGSVSLDFSTPPAPANLTATGTFSNIFLRWNHVRYNNHSYTEIWRAEVDNIGDAVLINRAGGNLYPDPVDDGREYYYWIRFVSKAGVAGPYNSAKGKLGKTAVDPTRILDSLTGNILESHLVEALQNDIDALRNEVIIKVNENGYVSGIGISVTEGESGDPQGIVVILADKFAIVSPGNDPTEPPKIPFVVGKVKGVNTVGISGALVVDGSIHGRSIVAESITADLLSVLQLSAISGDMGDLTAGTMRTGTAGMRAEISSIGTWPIWVGSGDKNLANAIFSVDTNGNAIFRGTLAAVNGVFTGTLDGVDGVFTGTVYAENLVGDVIDRLVRYEPKIGEMTMWDILPDQLGFATYDFSVEYGTNMGSVPSGTERVVYSLNISAGNFTRTLVAKDFTAFVLFDDRKHWNMEWPYHLIIRNNGSIVVDRIMSNYWKRFNANYDINFGDVAVDIPAGANAHIEYIIKFDNITRPASVYRAPGSKLIDLFKASSEGITYL